MIRSKLRWVFSQTICIITYKCHIFSTPFPFNLMQVHLKKNVCLFPTDWLTMARLKNFTTTREQSFFLCILKFSINDEILRKEYYPHLLTNPKFTVWVGRGKTDICLNLDSFYDLLSQNKMSTNKLLKVSHAFFFFKIESNWRISKVHTFQVTNILLHCAIKFTFEWMGHV